MSYVFLDDSPEGARVHAALEAWRVCCVSALLEDLFADDSMRDYMLEILPQVVDALASDVDLMKILYKHFKEPMDDILLDVVLGFGRRRRDLRDLCALIDPKGFAESDCNTRRYYAMTRMMDGDPLRALEIFRTILVFPRAGFREVCCKNILRAAMTDHVTYVKVISALHADGEYGILEYHIHGLNSGLGDTYECLQILLKWTLKTDDVRLFQQIRGAHYVSSAHALAEGAREIAAMLQEK